MKTIILILSILLTSNIYAQRIEILKKAHSFYKEKEYQKALESYEKLWKSGSGAKILGVDGKLNLAECYRLTDQPFKAKDLYMTVMTYFDDNTDNYLHYGQVLMQMGQYTDAIGQFQYHAKLLPEDGRAAKYISRIEAIREIKPLYNDVTITTQENVNDSLTRQMGVSYYGDAIVYASDEITDTELTTLTQGYFNLRISGIDAEGNMKESEKFSVSLNGADRNDGPATFSRDGRVIYYSQSVKDPEGNTVLQIWISSFKDEIWNEAQPLPVMFQGKNFTHPSLSGDGKQLYFSSNMKGTLGGLDIWVSNFEDGHWSYPKNLGKDINTSEDDSWPYIHPDGDLYFSSKGHGGYGGFDIYRTRPLGNGVDWLDVENMGTPFNTSFSDVSFILSDEQNKGFLCSNRAKSYNIFKFDIEGVDAIPLPAEMKARQGVGIAERRQGTDKLTAQPLPQETPLPEQRPDESDDEYIERMGTIVNEKAKKNKTKTQSNTTEEDIPQNGVDDSNYFDDNSEKKSDKVELIVKLQLIDGFGNPIPEAEVNVKNKFTDDSKIYNADAKGLIEIRLEPNQKYNLIGNKEGYQESSLPVSTMGAKETQTVGTNLELKKQ